MKPTREEKLKWERARERFRIEAPFPPRELREEQPIGTILSQILKTNEENTVAIPSVLIERWPVIAGAQIAGHTRPAHLRNGLLYVYVDHPGWLTEVRRIPKEHLLKKIDSISDIPEIKEIRFQLAPALRTFKNKKTGPNEAG